MNELITPANPKYFDIEHTFDHTDEIEWKQGAGIRSGDTVFMYVASPASAIQLSDKIQKSITAAMHDLKKAGVKGSFVPAQLVKVFDNRK